MYTLWVVHSYHGLHDIYMINFMLGCYCTSGTVSDTSLPQCSLGFPQTIDVQGTAGPMSCILHANQCSQCRHQLGCSETVVYVNCCQGQGVQSSTTLPGMVFKRQVEGEITKAEDCKIAVYSCPLDIMQTETKVMITSLITFCTIKPLRLKAKWLYNV